MAYALNAGSEITRMDQAGGPQMAQMCAEGDGGRGPGNTDLLIGLFEDCHTGEERSQRERTTEHTEDTEGEKRKGRSGG